MAKSDGLVPFLIMKQDASLPVQNTKPGEDEVPALQVHDTSDCNADVTCEAAPPDQRTLDGRCEDHEEDRGSHLRTMNISKQLRSMSQLSDPLEETALLSPPILWKIDQSERPNTGFSYAENRQHARQKSSTGLDSMALPSSWGRVRSPTAASSIYSRPTSAGANELDGSDHDDDRRPYTIPNDLDTLFADWPLKPEPATIGAVEELEEDALKVPGQERQEKPLPTTPSGQMHPNPPVAISISVDSKGNARRSSWFSTAQHGDNVAKTSSASILTASSKKSRFLERFSPPKRLVRKRRSMFKFLRPGSRKQQTRSISTPVLSVKSPSLMYDGPSDDPALLTVQYELSEHPQHNMRSLSTSQLGNAHAPGTNNQPPSSGLLHRSPTFAEYERNLSVMGDDRRRPSSMNLTRLHEIHEEDRKESVGIRKKLSRAKELKDDVSPLMAQALSKHQREKDLFRSSSKRHEAERAHRPTPVFSAPTFSHTGSSLAPTPEDHSELLDPLEKGELVGGAQYPHGGNFLSPMAAAGLSSRASAAASLGGPSTTASSYQLGAASAESRPTKIGTSLASWSKYPSHTRFERCGSAGRLDNVTTKDFALIDPEIVQTSDEDEPDGSPTSHANRSHAKPGKKLAKSRSLTFSGIVRYYSNLFHTSGFTGQNRRTSVTVGGRLEHPELEMLAPQAPDDHQHSHEHIKHLKDIVKEDAEKVAEYVRDEENKLEGYIRKEEEELEQFVRMEEGKIEDFVREEEDKFEGFVRKEEGKLKKFVHEEEDKWMHYQHAGPASSNAPFRTGSIFAAPNSNDHGHRHIEDGMIRPTKRPNASDLEASGGLRLDGTATAASAQAAVPPSAPSKAELWSNMYQDCVARPPSAGVAEAAQLPSRCESMPPPALKPMKARSPEQPKERDAHAKIRRFPSVTVVDDQKGHFRSVSLISVKTSRSTGFEKSSAHDLLELVREREEQEREKLLKGCGGDIME